VFGKNAEKISIVGKHAKKLQQCWRKPETMFREYASENTPKKYKRVRQKVEQFLASSEKTLKK